MEDMEKRHNEVKKNSLSALKKLMQDLVHKSMSDKGPSAVEVEVHHAEPVDGAEHDTENNEEGVSPFDSEELEHGEAHEVEAHLPAAHMAKEEPEESHEESEMKMPASLHEMIAKHLKNKK